LEAEKQGVTAVSVAHMLLLESCVQTGLLKNIPKQLVQCDSGIFRLSELHLQPNTFAREYVRQKFGLQYCCNAIVEPKIKSDRIVMDADRVQDLKNRLDAWFTQYNWEVVGKSLNQLFRDFLKEQEQQTAKNSATKKAENASNTTNMATMEG
jgi:hypothetical protein